MDGIKTGLQICKRIRELTGKNVSIVFIRRYGLRISVCSKSELLELRIKMPNVSEYNANIESEILAFINENSC